jgi:hypothetical protein
VCKHSQKIYPLLLKGLWLIIKLVKITLPLSFTPLDSGVLWLDSRNSEKRRWESRSTGTEAVSIDLRLLLQERQAPSGSQREQEPVVVPGRLERIEVLVIGLQVEITRYILLRWIDGSPIGVRITILGVLHFPTAPIDRQAGIPTLGIEFDFFQEGTLPRRREGAAGRVISSALWGSQRTPPCVPVCP